MAQIRAGGELVAAKPLPLRLSDPDDEPFLEVAAAAMAEFLVTGNLKHFPRDRRQGVRVVLPREFLDSGLRVDATCRLARRGMVMIESGKPSPERVTIQGAADWDRQSCPRDAYPQFTRA